MSADRNQGSGDVCLLSKARTERSEVYTTIKYLPCYLSFMWPLCKISNKIEPILEIHSFGNKEGSIRR